MEENIVLPEGQHILAKTFHHKHKNVTASKAGFRISAKEHWIGAAADGYISCDCCGKGVIEI